MSMTRLTAAALILTLTTGSMAMAQQGATSGSTNVEETKAVSPALADYRQTILVRDLWARPGLSARDRSIVTIAALIARKDEPEMRVYFAAALNSGVTPGEISEIITHLAFYTGWGNASAASVVAKEIFDARNIGSDQLAAAEVEHLPINEAAEADRVARVAESLGPEFQGLQDYTTNVLFKDLWLRPGLAPRDRSLTTISALIALGRFPQLTGHLNIGMDNGLTQPEITETITHLAFYAGWPNAISAAPVAKDVFAKRAS